MTRAEWIAEYDRILADLNLEAGAHAPDNGKCVMEAVAYLRGQKHSDRPLCVSPVIGAFMRNWNDSLPKDADRNRLLKPLIPVIVDTVTIKEDEITRSYMALDWLARVNAPAWLDLTDNLNAHAVALRGLTPITDTASCKAAQKTLAAARAAARAAGWDAVRAAAGDAARVAVRAAAGDAAWDAVRDAVPDAAWDAVRDAAGDAARVAAWAAAWDAARDAAKARLAPTVAALQESAQDLVRLMSEVGRG